MDVRTEPENVTAETLIGRQGATAPAQPLPWVGAEHPAAERRDPWAILGASDKHKQGGYAEPIEQGSKSFVWDGSRPLTLQLPDGGQILSLWIPGATAGVPVTIYAGAGQGVPIASTAQTGAMVSLPPGHNAVTLVAATPFNAPCLVTASGDPGMPSSAQVSATVTGGVDILSQPPITVAANQAIFFPSDYPQGATPFNHAKNLAILGTFTTLVSTNANIGQVIYVTYLSLRGLNAQNIEWQVLASNAGAQELTGIGDTDQTFSKPFSFGAATSNANGLVINSTFVGVATNPSFLPANITAVIQGYYL